MMAVNSTSQTIRQVQWVAYAVVAPIIVGGGILGNTLNLVVLTRPHLRGVMYRYLLALAAANLLALLLAITLLLDLLNAYDCSYVGAVFRAHLEMPLLNCFSASSVFLILEMTVERYLSIARPTHFPRMHNVRSAHRGIIAAFLGGLLLNMPLCWYRTIDRSSSNSTSCVWTVTDNTSVISNRWWKAYLWVSESAMRFIPLVSLIILNGLILSHFRSVAERRRRLREGGATPPSIPPDSGSSNSSTAPLPETPPPPPSSSKSPAAPLPTVSGTVPMAPLPTISSFPSSKRRKRQSPEEKRLFRIMLGIILLFITCTTPAAFLSLLYSETMEEEVGFQIFRAASNDLELLNFAANFYVYCLCSADIRSTFISVIWCRKWIRPSVSFRRNYH